MLFFLYCENELLLLILEAEIVFYNAGVAIVNALLKSLLVLFLLRFVEQLVFWSSIRAYKYYLGLNLVVLPIDFDLLLCFFFNCLEGD